MAAGVDYCLALLSDGIVQAWGSNSSGQLGDGTTTDSKTPVQVQAANQFGNPAGDLTDLRALAAGGFHSLALLADGTVRAWGSNSSGQLGDGSTSNRTSAVLVRGLDPNNLRTGVTAVVAGAGHSLALLSNGSVRAFGDNTAGQFGDGTTTNQRNPVGVRNLRAATAVAAGASHSAALLSNGRVQAWGSNFFGQIGDGTTIRRLLPVEVRT